MAGRPAKLGAKVPEPEGRMPCLARLRNGHPFLVALFVTPTEVPLPAAQLSDTAPGATARRLRARAALRVADRLLDELERLELQDKQDVPDSLWRLIEILEQAAVRAGIEHGPLIADCGVMRLMDDVYELEGKLLPRCLRRAYPTPSEHH